MRKVVYWHIDHKDGALIAAIRKCGVRNIARMSGVSPAMLSRWLRGQTGMSSTSVDKVVAAAEDAVAKGSTR